MIRFSVVIPAYNVSNYIENCINSVKNQSFKNYEIIVVEDCSTDSTLEILGKISGIKLVKHEENRGLGGARNSGIEASRGEYILFLDSDDTLYDYNTLENLNETIGESYADIVYSGFEAKGSKNFVFLPTEEECKKEYRLAKNKYVSVCAGCWNREFLLNNKVLFKEGVIYEDVLFMFEAIAKSKTYKLAKYPTFIYNTGREGSLTTKKQFKQIYDTLLCIENLCKLKDSVDKRYIPYLLERINEQKERLPIRLDRVINQELKINE